MLERAGELLQRSAAIVEEDANLHQILATTSVDGNYGNLFSQTNEAVSDGIQDADLIGGAESNVESDGDDIVDDVTNCPLPSASTTVINDKGETVYKSTVTNMLVSGLRGEKGPVAKDRASRYRTRSDITFVASTSASTNDGSTLSLNDHVTTLVQVEHSVTLVVGAVSGIKWKPGPVYTLQVSNLGDPSVMIEVRTFVLTVPDGSSRFWFTPPSSSLPPSSAAPLSLRGTQIVLVPSVPPSTVPLPIRDRIWFTRLELYRAFASRYAASRQQILSRGIKISHVLAKTPTLTLSFVPLPITFRSLHLSFLPLSVVFIQLSIDVKSAFLKDTSTLR